MCVASHSAILCGLGFLIAPLKCSSGSPGSTSLGIVACDIFSFETHSHMDLPPRGLQPGWSHPILQALDSQAASRSNSQES